MATVGSSLCVGGTVSLALSLFLWPQQAAFLLLVYNFQHYRVSSLNLLLVVFCGMGKHIAEHIMKVYTVDD